MPTQTEDSMTMVEPLRAWVVTIEIADKMCLVLMLLSGLTRVGTEMRKCVPYVSASWFVVR